MKVVAITGNTAAAIGAALCRPDLVAAYPITPQSSVVEYIASMISTGKLDAAMVQVESEHSAMSVVGGASMAGGRVFTATSAQGLALMYEPYFRAASLRLPIVMPLACREMTSPSSIWCGQQDAMSVREAGWMQVYVENSQEILDTIIQSYKLAEDKDVLLPINVCYDGFYLSHMMSRVEIPEQEDVDAFLPPHQQFDAKLDPNDPMAIDPLTEGSILMEYRKCHLEDMQNALGKIVEIDKEFGEKFGRSYGGLIEKYRMEDAEIALLTIGSMTGTARDAVDFLREQGIRVGLVKVRFMRPFPVEAIREALKDVKAWAAVDRSVCFGWNAGPVFSEALAAVSATNPGACCFSAIGGLGGMDITLELLVKCIRKLDSYKDEHGTKKTIWLNEDFLKEA